MANKYIDVSATYNGDGTASNQAASAGAPGAWNSLIECIKGTSGYAPSAGDTVYIRTHNGTTNLSQTMASDVTMASVATYSAPIDWIFDDGTVWATGGVFSLETPSFRLTFKQYNNIHADGTIRRFRIYSNLTGVSPINTVVFAGARYYGLFLDSNYYQNSSNEAYYYTTPYQESVFYDLKVYVGSLNSVDYFPVFYGPDFSSMTFYNLEVDLALSTQQGVLFRATNYGYALTIVGGRVLNGTSKQYIVRSTDEFQSNVKIMGFDCGDCTLQYPYTQSSSTVSGANSLRELSITTRQYPFDFYLYAPQGTFEFRQNQNYPTLNATLPDSAHTPWSVRVTPSYVLIGKPASFARMSKLYTLPPATKDITVEFLVEDKYGSVTNKDYWINVVYVDSDTGASKFLTSYDVLGGTTVEGSTAQWTTTLFGDPAKNFIKKKITVSTPTSIKQDSQIFVEFVVGKPSQQASDYLFIDPDPSLT